MLVILWDLIEEDKGWLSNAPLHMKQDTTSIEKKTLKLKLRLRFDLPAVASAARSVQCTAFRTRSIPYVPLIVLALSSLAISTSQGPAVCRKVGTVFE